MQIRSFTRNENATKVSSAFLNKLIKRSLNLARKVVLMKSSVCLMRHDTLVCIYIFIQLRKHYVRALGTNVIKKEDLKFQSFPSEIQPKGPEWEWSNNYIICLSVYAETFGKSQLTVNLVRWRCVAAVWSHRCSLCRAEREMQYLLRKTVGISADGTERFVLHALGQWCLKSRQSENTVCFLRTDCSGHCSALF